MVAFEPAVPASAKVEGNQFAVRLSPKDQELENRWRAQQKPKKVGAVTLASILGIKSREEESLADIPLTIEEIEQFLALSQELGDLLRGQERRNFLAAIVQAPVISLQPWQKVIRKRIADNEHADVRKQVIADSDAGSSLDFVGATG